MIILLQPLYCLRGAWGLSRASYTMCTSANAEMRFGFPHILAIVNLAPRSPEPQVHYPLVFSALRQKGCPKEPNHTLTSKP